MFSIPMSDRSILFRVLVLCAVMQVVKGKHKFKADLSGAAFIVVPDFETPV